jgi:hypothetical protein
MFAGPLAAYLKQNKNNYNMYLATVVSSAVAAVELPHHAKGSQHAAVRPMWRLTPSLARAFMQSNIRSAAGTTTWQPCRLDATDAAKFL